jgi:hypothetical protein
MTSSRAKLKINANNKLNVKTAIFMLVAVRTWTLATLSSLFTCVCDVRTGVGNEEHKEGRGLGLNSDSFPNETFNIKTI